MSAVASPDTQLRISEIFHSLQGEATRIGLPTVFVRLTGCPLRCSYCDTAYAFSGGTVMMLDAILDEVAAWQTRQVLVTGGEPLAQKGCLLLLRALCDAGYEVSLETSGALDVSGVDARVARIVDIKTPASGEVEKNRWQNLDVLNARDEIKFVLCGETDYLWAREQVEMRQLAARCEVLFSPAHGQLEPAQLADWILRDRLQVRFQLQLHKLLWSDARGR